MKASLKNHTTKQTEGFDWVEEYNKRKALAELGYSFSSDDLTDYEASIFCEIATLYTVEETAVIKKKGKI